MTAAFVRRNAEASMRDRCTITRDPRGPESRPFDENTLTYGPAPDATPIYAGKCSVVPDTDQQPEPVTEGGQDIYRDRYRLRIPLGATPPEPGDWVTITAVDPRGGDPALLGRDYQLVQVKSRSRAVTRQLRMVDRTRGPRA